MGKSQGHLMLMLRFCFCSKTSPCIISDLPFNPISNIAINIDDTTVSTHDWTFDT